VGLMAIKELAKILMALREWARRRN